jgi:hypothetical protein
MKNKIILYQSGEFAELIEVRLDEKVVVSKFATITRHGAIEGKQIISICYGGN